MSIFNRITAGTTDEELDALCIEHGIEPMSPVGHQWYALARRARDVVEAFEDRPDAFAELEAWIRDGERLVTRSKRTRRSA